VSVYATLLKLYQEKPQQIDSRKILQKLKDEGHLSDTELAHLLELQKTVFTSGIFISYHRQDSRWFTRDLHAILLDEFPNTEIFWDLELALGEDFTQAIEKAVQSCSVMLVVMGNNWLNAQDETGQRRLDNPHDYVGLEIAAALKRSILIIPILIDKTPMPQAKDLPRDLQDLVKRQALEVDEKRFRHDIELLLTQLKTYFEKA
jgi:hypothetical protein